VANSGVVLGEAGARVGDQVGVSLVNAGSCASGTGNRTYDGTYTIAEILSPTSFRSTAADPGGNEDDCPIAGVGWAQTPRNDTGSVWWFSGAQGVPRDNPSAVYWPVTQPGQNLVSLAGGFDWNGDGRSDTALGSPDWDRVAGATTTNNVGGIEIVFGRSLAGSAGRTQIICAADARVLGLLGNDNVGRSIAPLRDVDGDGCDELVVGAPGEDLGKTDQGSVRVLFGAGPACRTNTIRALTFVSGETSAQAGGAVAAGGDLDGDGLDDVVVGGANHRRGPDTVGIVWVLRGSRLAALAAQAAVLVDNVAPATTLPLLDGADAARLTLEGTSGVDRVGNAVALVPQPPPSTRAALVVGASIGGPGGVLLSGGARVHDFDAAGVALFPRVVVGGETRRTGSLLGELVRGGRLGTTPVILVGGTQSAGSGPDEGGAYSAPILP
jgi:hypothetical protein